MKTKKEINDRIKYIETLIIKYRVIGDKKEIEMLFNKLKELKWVIDNGKNMD